MHISPSPSTSVSPHLLHASSSLIVTLPHLSQSRSPPHSQASVQHHRQVSASLQNIAFDCVRHVARPEEGWERRRRDTTRGEERRGQERRGEDKRGGEICRERGESSRGDTSDRNEREERTVRVRRGVVHTHRSTLTISCSMLSLLIHLTRRFTPPVSLSSVIHDTHILYLLSLLLLRDSHFRFSLPPPRDAPPAGVASSAV